jgi:hypothetical protein
LLRHEVVPHGSVGVVARIGFQLRRRETSWSVRLRADSFGRDSSWAPTGNCSRSSDGSLGARRSRGLGARPCPNAKRHDREQPATDLPKAHPARTLLGPTDSEGSDRFSHWEGGEKRRALGRSRSARPSDRGVSRFPGVPTQWPIGHSRRDPTRPVAVRVS